MKKQIVSLSGGKDSTAMLLLMLERGEPIDKILFFDTGWEFPQMYEHIKRLQKYIGREITIVEPPKRFTYMLLTHPVKHKSKGIIRPGYGWPYGKSRWCSEIKIRCLKNAAPRHAIQCIGIAADETRRIRDKRYPLVEWGITEAEALAICYRHGFDWGGLYGVFRRVSCFCCPQKSVPELYALYRQYPDIWRQMLKWHFAIKSANPEMPEKAVFKREKPLVDWGKRFREQARQCHLPGEAE